ncbi:MULTISPECIES: hypothetical protein [Okeania]|uniref:Transposase n=1 Tax=Okeania hirsuta TaxID=1458930 RepID=A0A3N6P389_9CYAN|nr:MULTISPECIES: hypothetical protein [Okeania]NEP42453.1 hypothetical protein [Okeania sp. SIO2H7]NET12339.1 hypothetical protein [Okeania sp. SIO1H6]NEP74011.1 hypothetical protein [Okeania sp. SIO2G5]NEP94830.1 hypothetical protein [Okeania sp. SIO2F5]NEQ93791.1 hypothetical protein [Okeania sp. SIO2G4]
MTKKKPLINHSSNYQIQNLVHQKYKIIRHCATPRIGWVKTFEILPDNVNLSSVTISRKANRWFISFKIKTEPQISENSVDVVSVDLGVKTLATLSLLRNV